MTTDPTRIERLRTALQAARARIIRNAKMRLFFSSGTTALAKDERDARRTLALALADELGDLAAGDLESLPFGRLSAIYLRLQSIGLIISGPELIELNTAFFAARSMFAA